MLLSHCLNYKFSSCFHIAEFKVDASLNYFSPFVSEAYKSGISWNCNRLLTFLQAEELQKALHAKNVPATVYVGMRYWHPFTEEAIEKVCLKFQFDQLAY